MTVTASTLYNYGRFVYYAYQMYAESVKGGGAPDLSPPTPADWPSDYEILTNIVMDDEFDPDYKTQFYGFYAIKKSDPSEVIIAIRGTQSIAEWLDDFLIDLVDFKHVPSGGQVCQGFQDIYDTFSIRAPKGGAELKTSCHKEYIAELAAKGITAVIVGHSLGSSLVNLLALDLAANNGIGSSLTVYPFASPKTGDLQFQTAFNSYVPNCTRVTNKPDIIPQLPLDFLGWHYYPVGGNFEVNSQADINVKNSIGCYHSIMTYLYELEDTNPIGLLPACRAF